MVALSSRGLIGTAVLLFVAAAASGPDARAQTCATLRYTFQPDCYRSPDGGACVQSIDRLDLGPQIAVWVESADRAQFVDTLMVTNMVAARGIGNRPGVSNFLSSPFFPYGKRQMALPIWAHARGRLYDSVVMQDREETGLGFHEISSSGEPYYCRPLMATEINVDAITCPTRFNSVKGRLDPSTKSYYPPRNDLTMFGSGDCDTVGATLPGCAVSAMSYAALNDLDAVAAATPAYGARYTGSWRIPDGLGAGDYALLVEVNKEFDNNAAHHHPSYEDPDLAGFGLPNNFGQPSVVYRVPIRIDGVAQAAAVTSEIAGYSDWTGQDGVIMPPDGTISTLDPGSGEARLLEFSTAAGSGRVHVTVGPCGGVSCAPPPPAPAAVSGLAVDANDDRSVVVTFVNAEAVASYEVRYREGDELSDGEFLDAIRAPQVIPGAPGSRASVTLAGLKPATPYVVAVRAADACGQTSAIAQLAFTTAMTQFKKVDGCFVATAAWGSALASQVQSLRRIRDRLRPGSATAATAVDLYYRAGPAAANVLRRSDTARAAVRRLLSPVTAAAEAFLSL